MMAGYLGYLGAMALRARYVELADVTGRLLATLDPALCYLGTLTRLRALAVRWLEEGS